MKWIFVFGLFLSCTVQGQTYNIRRIIMDVTGTSPDTLYSKPNVPDSFFRKIGSEYSFAFKESTAAWSGLYYGRAYMDFRNQDSAMARLTLQQAISQLLVRSILTRRADSIGSRAITTTGDTSAFVYRFGISDKADTSRSYIKAASDVLYQPTGSYVTSSKHTTDSTAFIAAILTKVLTGYSSTTGTISASDNILTAINKLNGNVAAKSNTASPTFTGIATIPSIKHGRRAVADANATLATSDYLIAFTSITAARTVTLPAASTCTNQFFIIKDESGNAGLVNTISIVGTVDGAANPVVITIGRGLYKIYSNGTAWFTW